MTAVANESDRELVFQGPSVLAELVRSGELHPRELVEACLRRIEALNPRLNAFRVTLAEEALATAERPLEGPLAGVPIAVKDDLAMAGQIATRGARTYHGPAAVDAEPLRRLRAAGAIPIGITNVPELLIFPWTVTEANGPTRNPWSPDLTPGGSSGGSAAATAAGMVPCATGSDGGGSIRIPAACCGLVGMKSTRGRVSSQPGGEGWFGLSVYGGLARTVRDSALLLDVMHGPADGEKPTIPEFQGSYVDAAGTPPGRLRIGISSRIPSRLGRLSSEQRSAWERTAEVLERLGHEVVERDPAYGFAHPEFVQLFSRAVYETTREVPEPGKLESTTRQMGALGHYGVPSRRRDALLAKREETSQRIMALWDEIDVLLTPGLARTPIGAEVGLGKPALVAMVMAEQFMPYTPMFNVTGQPAVSLPAGLSDGGLPLSVQLVGRRGDEALLYSLAGELEEAQPWENLRPPIS